MKKALMKSLFWGVILSFGFFLSCGGGSGGGGATFIGNGIVLSRVYVNGVKTLTGRIIIPFDVQVQQPKLINVVIDLNNDGKWGAYSVGGQTQQEWVVQNMPAVIFPNEPNGFSFDLPDVGVDSLTNLKFRAVVTDAPIDGTKYPNGWDGTIPAQTDAAQDFVVSSVLVENRYVSLVPGFETGPGSARNGKQAVGPAPVSSATPLPSGPSSWGDLGARIAKSSVGSSPRPEEGAGKVRAVSCPASVPSGTLCGSTSGGGGTTTTVYHPNVPNLKQGGSNECAPTSAANSLLWMANTYGYNDQIFTNPASSQPNHDVGTFTATTTALSTDSWTSTYTWSNTSTSTVPNVITATSISVAVVATNRSPTNTSTSTTTLTSSSTSEVTCPPGEYFNPTTGKCGTVTGVCFYKERVIQCPPDVPPGSESLRFNRDGDVIFPASGGGTIAVSPSSIVYVPTSGTVTSNTTSTSTATQTQYSVSNTLSTTTSTSTSTGGAPTTVTSTSTTTATFVETSVNHNPLIEEIKKDLGFTAQSGVSPANFVPGKNTFAAAHNLPIDTHEISANADGQFFDNIFSELAKGQDVEMGVSIIDKNGNAAGGHKVTVVGETSVNGTNTIHIHDSALTNNGTDSYQLDATGTTLQGFWPNEAGNNCPCTAKIKNAVAESPKPK